MSHRVEQRECGLGCHELGIVTRVGGLKDTEIMLPPPNRKVISLTGWVLQKGVGFLFLGKRSYSDTVKSEILLGRNGCSSAESFPPFFSCLRLHKFKSFPVHLVCSAHSINFFDASLNPPVMTTVNLESQ